MTLVYFHGRGRWLISQNGQEKTHNNCTIDEYLRESYRDDYSSKDYCYIVPSIHQNKLDSELRYSYIEHVHCDIWSGIFGLMPDDLKDYSDTKDEGLLKSIIAGPLPCEHPNSGFLKLKTHLVTHDNYYHDVADELGDDFLDPRECYFEIQRESSHKYYDTGFQLKVINLPNSELHTNSAKTTNIKAQFNTLLKLIFGMAKENYRYSLENKKSIDSPEKKLIADITPILKDKGYGLDHKSVKRLLEQSTEFINNPKTHEPINDGDRECAIMVILALAAQSYGFDI